MAVAERRVVRRRCGGARVRRLLDLTVRALALVGIALHVDDAAGDDVDARRSARIGRCAAASCASSSASMARRAQDDVGDAVARHRRRPRRSPTGSSVSKTRSIACTVRADLAGADAQAVFDCPTRSGSWPSQTSRARKTLVSIGGSCVQAGDLAALDEDLLVQRDADGLPGLGLGARAPARSSPRSLATRAVLLLGENSRRSPTASRPVSMRPDDDAALVELVDVLDRQAQRQLGRPRRRAAGWPAPPSRSGRRTRAWSRGAARRCCRRRGRRPA